MEGAPSLQDIPEHVITDLQELIPLSVSDEQRNLLMLHVFATSYANTDPRLEHELRCYEAADGMRKVFEWGPGEVERYAQEVSTAVAEFPNVDEYIYMLHAETHDAYLRRMKEFD